MSFEPIKNKAANKVLSTDNNNEVTVKGTTGTGNVVLENNASLLGTTNVQDLGVSGAVTLSGNPVSALQAATKQYVDAVVSGLDIKNSVRVATTAALPAVTYNNGASGLGATLTADANGALPSQDGVSLSVNDRILVKDQVAGLQNGIYQVTQLGDGSNPFILTRTTDSDNSPSGGEVTPGMFTFIEEGTTNADNGWVIVTDGTITIGTTSISFTQFSGAGGSVTAGDGLTKSGNTLNVETADPTRIVVNADNIDLATTGVSAGTFTKFTVDLYGRLTNATSILSSDITTALGFTPLNKAGDTITGNLLLGTGVNILADDGVSTLGNSTHRFATLFMSSVINIKSGSSLQIGHGSDDLVVHSSGRILVGTSTDDATNKLQVAGSVKFSPSNGTLTFTEDTFSLLNNISSTGPSLRIGRASEEAFFAVSPSTNSFSNFSVAGDLVVRTSSGNLILTSRTASGHIKFGTAAPDSERMRLTSGGSLLLGTTSDDGTNKFQVTGNTKLTGEFVTTGKVGLMGATHARRGVYINPPSTVLTDSVSQRVLAVGGTLDLSINASTVNAVEISLSGSGTGSVSQVTGIELYDISGGTFSSLPNDYAILIADITRGTNNYAIKTGLGRVSFGDVVGIGSTNAAHALRISGVSLTSTTQYAVVLAQATSSAATSIGCGLYVSATTAAAAFTQTSSIGIQIDAATKGAGSTMTTLYGLKIEDQTAGGTNYAIYTGLGSVQFGDNVTLANGNLSVDWTRIGNDVRTLIRNNDNTNGASNAISYVIVGGASSGDAYSRYSISGVKDWSVGIDNSDSDAFVVSESGSPGSSNRLKIAVGGAVSIPGTLDVTGLFTTGSDSIRISTSKTPSSASDTGTQGQIAWDSGFIYVCTATNTWKRVAIATW